MSFPWEQPDFPEAGLTPSIPSKLSDSSWWWGCLKASEFQVLSFPGLCACKGSLENDIFVYFIFFLVFFVVVVVEMEACSVAQARVQSSDLGSPQPLPLRFM